jgi:hypothetical protein
MARRIALLFAAILVGIVAGLAIEIALSAALHAIGIPTWIDFGGVETMIYGGGNYTVEKQSDNAFTIAGSALAVVSVMSGVWAGRMVYHRRLDGGFSADGALLYRAWLFGVMFYGAIGAVLFALFGREPGLTGLIHKLLQLGGLIATYMIFSRWLARRRRAARSDHAA